MQTGVTEPGLQAGSGVGYRRTVMPSAVTKRLRYRPLQGAGHRRKNRGAVVTRGPEPPFRCAA
jgi:hypothetical protein